jgi:hypothetical protein
LEDRTVLSGFTLGPPVQVAPTDPFASCKPGKQVGTYYPGTQVEPRLAVDPTNPSHMVGVWQQDRWNDGGSFGNVAAVTFDAGKTWTEVAIPGITTCAGGAYDRGSDPWVSFGPTGTVYVSSLALDGNDDTGVTESAVLVNRSTDGGLTWGPPATIIQSGTGVLNDKEAVTADPHNANLVYVVWDQPDLSFPSSGTGGQTFFSRSTDGGQTWSAPQVIFQSPGSDSSVGHQIVVLPNGTLVDAFNELHFDPSTFTTSYFLDILRSTDGGVTWSQPVVAAQQMTLGVNDPFDLNFVRSGANLPEVAADPASGNLYAVWEDARFSNNQYESIAFAMSGDGGLTWSAPIQVNQTPVSSAAAVDSQAFTPAVAVNANGTVAVSYYDFRFGDAIAGAGTDSWAVFGNPGGAGGLTNPANWGNEQRLTGASFNLLNAPNASGWFLGDYEGLAATGNSFEAFFSEAGSTFPQSAIFARQILAPAGGFSAAQAASANPATALPAALSAQPRPQLVGAASEFLAGAAAPGATAPSTASALQAGPNAAPSGFLAPAGYPVDQGLSDVAVGDFNGDGNLDIVTANTTANDVSLLLGNGSGTFQPTRNDGVGKSPVAVAVGDFNNDGNLDIATVNVGSFTSNSNGTSFLGSLAVTLGKGNGTFPNTTTYLLPNVIGIRPL